MIEIVRSDLFKRGRDGYIHYPLYEILLDATQSIPGTFIEFGVYAGYTFRVIYERARLYGKKAIGVDSFIGHPEIRRKEEKEWCKPGKYSVGGSATFRKTFPEALCIEGFIPAVLSEINDIRIAFAHIDLNLYDSTMDALCFAWQRLLPGGILVGHDFDLSVNIGSASAYRDWMKLEGIEYVGVEESSVFFKK